jgi:hypothetical protein
MIQLEPPIVYWKILQNTNSKNRKSKSSTWFVSRSWMLLEMWYGPKPSLTKEAIQRWYGKNSPTQTIFSALITSYRRISHQTVEGAGGVVMWYRSQSVILKINTNSGETLHLRCSTLLKWQVPLPWLIGEFSRNAGFIWPTPQLVRLVVELIFWSATTIFILPRLT